MIESQSGYQHEGKIELPPSRDEKMAAMVDWLIQYEEGWHGPRAGWNKKQRDQFDAYAGLLMLFIDGFKFTK